MIVTTEPTKYDDDGYILLPNEFIDRGFAFKLCMNIDKEWKVFQRHHIEHENHVHYELVKILRQEEYELGGNVIPKRYRYPSSESWGRLGFTCSSRERAAALYDEIMLANIPEEEIKVNFPKRKSFTIKDICTLNPTIEHEQIQSKIKTLLEDKVIKIEGKKENKKGKPSTIYQLV